VIRSLITVVIFQPYGKKSVFSGYKCGCVYWRCLKVMGRRSNFDCGRWPLNGGSILDYLWNICAAINIDSQGAMCVCACVRVIHSLKEETVTMLLPIFTLNTDSVVLTGWQHSHALLTCCMCVQRGNSYSTGFILFMILNSIFLHMPGFNVFTLLLFVLFTPLFYFVFYLLNVYELVCPWLFYIFPCHFFILCALFIRLFITSASNDYHRHH
jgi:hypothetical protein